MIGFRLRRALLGRRVARSAALGGAVVGALVGALTGGMVTPAAAHGVGGPQATNIRSEILSVSGPLADVRVSLVEFGEQLKVANHGTVPVSVVGLNGVVTRTIAAGRTEMWHEHTVHWMGPSEPPVVRSAPDVSHVLIPRWELRLVAGGDEMVVVGRVVWFPSVSPWPWVVVTLAGMVGVVGLRLGVRGDSRGVRGRGVRGLAALPLTALLGAGALRLAGLVLFDPGRWADGLWREGAGVVGTVALVMALGKIVRRSDVVLGASAVVGAMAMLLAVGIVDVTWWALPVLPTTVQPGYDRGLIAIVIACAVPTVFFGMRGLLGLGSRRHSGR